MLTKDDLLNVCKHFNIYTETMGDEPKRTIANIINEFTKEEIVKITKNGSFYIKRNLTRLMNIQSILSKFDKLDNYLVERYAVDIVYRETKKESTRNNYSKDYYSLKRKDYFKKYNWNKKKG